MQSAKKIVQPFRLYIVGLNAFSSRKKVRRLIYGGKKASLPPGFGSQTCFGLNLLCAVLPVRRLVNYRCCLFVRRCCVHAVVFAHLFFSAPFRVYNGSTTHCSVWVSEVSLTDGSRWGDSASKDVYSSPGHTYVICKRNLKEQATTCRLSVETVADPTSEHHIPRRFSAAVNLTKSI